MFFHYYLWQTINNEMIFEYCAELIHHLNKKCQEQVVYLNYFDLLQVYNNKSIY